MKKMTEEITRVDGKMGTGMYYLIRGGEVYEMDEFNRNNVHCEGMVLGPEREKILEKVRSLKK